MGVSSGIYQLIRTMLLLVRTPAHIKSKVVLCLAVLHLKEGFEDILPTASLRAAHLLTSTSEYTLQRNQTSQIWLSNQKKYIPPLEQTSYLATNQFASRVQTRYSLKHTRETAPAWC